jgi:hypothetical protein
VLAQDCKRWHVGSLRVSGPHKHVRGMSVRWEVIAVDEALEDVASKFFPSKAKAQAFIDQLVEGAPPIDPLASEGNTKTVQADRVLNTQLPARPTLDGRHTRSRGRLVEGEPKDAATAPFNLRAVKAVLEDEQMDPFVEIARALTETVPVLMADGSPRLDPATGEPLVRRAIGARDRASILIELAQYYTPKLKAVEMKVEDKRDLSEQQLDERIGAILERADKAREHATIVTPGAGL